MAVKIRLKRMGQKKEMVNLSKKSVLTIQIRNQAYSK